VILAFCHEASIRKEKVMKEKRVQVKERVRKNLLLFLGLMVLFCFAGAVQAADFRFQEVEGSNGSIIRDNTTGLEWQRCPFGQSWTGSDCSGAAWIGRWSAAIRMTASGGFRLPTIDELKTLAPYNQNIFPGTDWFWSASLYPANGYYAWGLYFDSGHVRGRSQAYNGGRVRYVRGGQ
jgi:hypothetical protein